ncbi:DUF1003 domain-containing protein [Ancylobacter sp. A5.8]|uniref:DUF1003 domain-containing protein n=1 Tax=Ancylobacter gelatini TaxID=2919920 RepID=UPI001F4DA649|nr:DUF1003 domain-containing protein [Ancylobacter gelatini]MCJ8145165.1 DUF1003 domain-containing protein [Ancylobacter gelatini]
MSRNGHKDNATHKCALTGQSITARDGVRLDMLRPSLADHIRSLHPELPPDALISRAALSRERAAFIAQTLEAERGALSELDRDVIDSLAQNDILAENIEIEIDERRSFAERASDTIARFGGSWTFILSFSALILIWMSLNVALAASAPFDPYPFILLNLVLSCIAAFQAPIIMMSQKRQEAKDRLRSENDYRVNLKAELEIRHLHEKVDHMLTHQWQRLAEMQSIQIELMEDLLERRR